MMNKLANDIAVAVNYKLAGLGLAKPIDDLFGRATAGLAGNFIGSGAGGLAGIGIGGGVGGLKGLADVIKNRNDNSFLTRLKRGVGLSSAPSIRGDIGTILTGMISGADTGASYGTQIGGAAGAIHGVLRGPKHYYDDVEKGLNYLLY